MTDFTIPSRVAKDGHRTLLRTIECAVIPRLILAHRNGAAGKADVVAAEPRIPESDVLTFTEIILYGSELAAQHFVTELQQRGIGADSIRLDLLANAARRLGVFWESERADFIQVTVGLRRLQQLAHRLSEDGVDPVVIKSGHKALLVNLPGEQHVFGTQLVSDMLRGAGWDVWDAPGASEQDIITLVKNEWFAVVGLSIGGPEQMEPLALIIREIRRHSANRSVGIMVGGNSFAEQSDGAARVGADTTAVDGRDAVAQAEKLLELMSQRN